jgi:purine-nucleoside phosphorylase
MHKKASEFLKNTITEPAKIGLILGSGLGILAEEFENPIYLDYSNIPGFPKSTVEGHKGRFVYGEYANKKVLAMQGRFIITKV